MRISSSSIGSVGAEPDWDNEFSGRIMSVIGKRPGWIGQIP